MKHSPYSFSKLSLHEQCPRRFKYRYIDKIKEEKCKNKEALYKGRAIHSILEHYPEESTHKLASKYKYITDNFINSELGKKYLLNESLREFRFGLTQELKPCNYSDKDCIFRGSVDLIMLKDNILYLADYKSGKASDIRWQNFNQLMFYGIYFFMKYTKIQKIQISYVYVEHDTENDILLERKYLDNYITELMNCIKNTEKDKDFLKVESKLCEWCPYKEYCDIMTKLDV